MISVNNESIDVNDVVEVLTHLQLAIIPQVYVDEIIVSLYNSHQFPESYENNVMPNINFSFIINNACNLLRRHLKKKPNMHVLWDQFIIKNTCPKPLSCLLNCYIQNGLKYVKDPINRKNGLSATRLYVLACTFKTSKINGFYHYILLRKCLQLVKSCVTILYDRENDGDYINGVQLEENKKNNLIVDLLAIVRDIAIMVTRFQFHDESISLSVVIDLMIDVTRLERNHSNVFVKIPTKEFSFSSLAFDAYNVLKNMFNDNCGSKIHVGKEVMKFILSALLVNEQHEMKLTTKQFNVIRDHHIEFIRILTNKCKSSFEPVLEILLQHLLHRGPDCSELKQRQYQIVLIVWSLCSNNIRIKFKYYLLCMVYDRDAKLRMVALDILFKMLSESEEDKPKDSKLLQLMPATKHEFIVALIFSKFQDPMITVRAKAISLIVDLTAGPPTATAHQTALIKRALVDPYIDDKPLEQMSFYNNDFHEFYQYVKNELSDFNTNSIINYKIYPGAKILLRSLNVHVFDERVYIRRNSLALFCNLFQINKKLININYLSLLLNSCLDESMTVRKVVISGLTNLLLTCPDNYDVLKCWFKGLIYLVEDNDKKIQDLAVECLNRVILNNIKPYSVKTIDFQNPLDNLPWCILNYALNLKVNKYMMCLCKKWHINGFLTHRILKDIMTYVNTTNHRWIVSSSYLLQLISHQMTITNISPIVQYFDTNFDSWFLNKDNSNQQNVLISHAQIILDVLFLNHQSLNKETKQRLLNQFENLLFNFKVPTRLIPKSLDLYTKLHMEKFKTIQNYLNELFQNMFNSIHLFGNIDDEEIIIRYICTLGEIALVQNLQIKPELKKYLLSILRDSNKTISSALKSITVLTIGKLSIIDEKFAKDIILIFRVILKSICHPSIKINALFSLFDLCLRYPTLTDQVLPDLCICLKSDCLSVKRVALNIVIRLLLEDYTKLRNFIFFSLLCMLEDSDRLIRQEILSVMVNHLLIKIKNIIELKIIEIIFYFNGFTELQLESCLTSFELKTFFLMEGESKKSSRHYIYRFMLKYLSNKDKLKLLVKICKIIFEELVICVKKNSEVMEVGAQVIRDAFWILKTKEMALSFSQSLNEDSVSNVNPKTSETLALSVKEQAVVDCYKTIITNCVIPSILRLKYMVDKRNKFYIFIINDLREYLCELLSTESLINNEIMELLTVDSDLKNDILHEIKQKMNDHVQSSKDKNSFSDEITPVKNVPQNVSSKQSVLELTDSDDDDLPGWKFFN